MITSQHFLDDQPTITTRSIGDVPTYCPGPRVAEKLPPLFEQTEELLLGLGVVHETRKSGTTTALGPATRYGG